MALSPIIREKPPEVPPEVRPECIHCYGSGWILDATEEDEDRTMPCHMCSPSSSADDEL